MSKIVSVLDMNILLSNDLGRDAASSGAFDNWFITFVNRPAISFGDISFGRFSTLSFLKGGWWDHEINGALLLAKLAIAMPVTSGTITPTGERSLSIGKDFWQGGSGHDKVNSGGGDDALRLKAGNDTVQGGSGSDLIFGEGGSDSLIGGQGNDTIFGGRDRDFIYGWNGDDVIFGGSGNDGLFGNEGTDTISGGDGNDYICGGSGQDFLFGGAGADTFAFRGQAPHSITVIKDFDILEDRQLIMASVAAGALTVDMIQQYTQGLRIMFTDNRAIYYENVSDVDALFARMSLFE